MTLSRVRLDYGTVLYCTEQYYNFV
jgi:hypothetical protein